MKEKANYFGIYVTEVLRPKVEPIRFSLLSLAFCDKLTFST